MKSRYLLGMLALQFALVASSAATAQTFPNRPVRLISPYAAGGTADVLSRIIGKHMNGHLGQTVIIDNRPGAAGLIGAAALAQSAPDGYTIGVLATPHAATPIDKKVGFDPADLDAVALVAVVPNLLSVHVSVPAKNLQDVIALARSQPGKLAYGNTGNFSSGHLGMEMLKQESKVDIIAVPYKGGAPALQDLVAGHIHMSISGPQNFLPYIKSGQLRPIATTGAKRSTAVPEIPTFAESGLPNFELNEWYAIFVPKNTPKDIVARLNKEILRSVNEPEVRTFFNTIGAESSAMSPEQVAAYFKNERTKLGKLVGSLGLQGSD